MSGAPPGPGGRGRGGAASLEALKAKNRRPGEETPATSDGAEEAPPIKCARLGETAEKPADDAAAAVPGDTSNEEALLQRTLAMIMGTTEGEEAAPAARAPTRDLASMTVEEQIAYAMQMSAAKNLASMTEAEQIAYAMQMSMANLPGDNTATKEESMEVDDKDADYSEVMNDPAFLQSVLQNLPRKVDDMYMENLEEWILEENKIVTYKYLSSSLKCHVNVAKQMLFKFLEEQQKKGVSLGVVYLLSGFMKPQEDAVRRMKVCLVKQSDLKKATSKFDTVTSKHIYSLSKTEESVNPTALYATDYAAFKEDVFSGNSLTAVKNNMAVPMMMDPTERDEAAPAARAPTKDFASMTETEIFDRKIYVGDLPLDIRADEVYSYFSMFGNIVNHRLKMEQHPDTGEDLCFAWVVFKEASSIDAALKVAAHFIKGTKVKVVKKKKKQRKVSGENLPSNSGSASSSTSTILKRFKCEFQFPACSKYLTPTEQIENKCKCELTLCGLHMSPASHFCEISSDAKIINMKEKNTFDETDELDREYRLAEGHFLRLTSIKSKKIVSIDLVRNEKLEARFEAKKEELMKKEEPTECLLLFHGTPQQNIRPILENNFDVSIISNGRALGNGVYFSERPEVSFNYSRDHKSLILCKVLKASNCVEKKKGPVGGKMKGNNRDRCWAIVVPDVDQVLPRYVIHFK